MKYLNFKQNIHTGKLDEGKYCKRKIEAKIVQHFIAVVVSQP